MMLADPPTPSRPQPVRSRADEGSGNPVNLVEVEIAELLGLLAGPGPSVWHDAARDGVGIAGAPLTEVTRAA